MHLSIVSNLWDRLIWVKPQSIIIIFNMSIIGKTLCLQEDKKINFYADLKMVKWVNHHFCTIIFQNICDALGDNQVSESNYKKVQPFISIIFNFDMVLLSQY